MKYIQVDHVSKSFKDLLLFDGVDITFESGHIYGLVGPNGTGKTVFLKLLCGLTKPNHGSIIIDGQVLNKDIDFPPNTGVIIDKPAFFNELSGFDNLMLLRNIQKKIDTKTVEHYLQLFGLTKNHQPVSKYSLGMKQRLGLAQAFMESPDLVILDEYTNGLDRSGKTMVKSFIQSYINDERIIILTSHYDVDLNDVCDVMYEIDDQRIKPL